MKSVRAVAFKRPEPESIVWRCDVRGEDASGFLKGFDYEVRIPVESTVDLDCLSWLESGSAARGDRYDLRIQIISQPTGVVVSSIRESFAVGLSAERIVLSEELAGALGGADLEVEAQLVYTGSQRSGQRDRLLPWIPGTVVWSKTKTVKLRGTGASLPIQSVNFAETGELVPSDTPWLLKIKDADLARPAANCILLMLNTSVADVVTNLKQVRTGDALGEQALSLYGSVRIQMIRRAVELDGLEPDDAYPDGSVGQVLLRVCDFDGMHLASLRNLKNASVERYEGYLTALARRTTGVFT